ncbi:Uncharacterized conserved protein, DUF1501 family [Salinihabitans flavidus]|uniref:Uncharacterized conserved protein, DUF1501 family n=2 Tax=Salinihabitans flavidus TaxID=569882 RepID=A0A1H8QRB9_9RHOB|nr:Uncharacterized conserved protein, DUF1501 family [Salinihabitans flavidus]
MGNGLTRRQVLWRAGALGCSAAASPLLTPLSFASAPWDNRLVAIILRGGMDGLDICRPVGDSEFAGLRPGLSEGGVPLDGFFELHPDLADLEPLWQAQELAFVHATSTPYRDKRSHFDGQDLLEAGTAALGSSVGRDGWLNRMLAEVPGAVAETAYAIGREEMLLMAGAAPVSGWWPDLDITLSAQGLRLLEATLRDDPAMAEAMAQAVLLADSDGSGVIADSDAPGAAMTAMTGDMQAATSGKPGQAHLRIAEFTARKLREETRVAAFSLSGWDSHSNQAQSLRRPLRQLSQVLNGLRDGLGPNVWGKTTVIAMTEFGRTARINGTGGTDHGTGGTMILAGGALRGGRVLGHWPGLAEGDLHARRDLMPTSDVRSWTAWILRESFGLSQERLEREVFPGLDMGSAQGILR